MVLAIQTALYAVLHYNSYQRAMFDLLYLFVSLRMLEILLPRGQKSMRSWNSKSMRRMTSARGISVEEPTSASAGADCGVSNTRRLFA